MVGLGALSSVAMGSAKVTFFIFSPAFTVFFLRTMVVFYVGSGAILLLLGGDSLPWRHLLELI
jgi:hypothetical protein